MHYPSMAFAAVMLNAAAMAAAGTALAPAQAVWQVAAARPEPLRWPQFPREPEPRPLPQKAYRKPPGSSLGWSSYGRAPNGGTTSTYRSWPRSGRIYPPPYGLPCRPEPLRWPEYPH